MTNKPTNRQWFNPWLKRGILSVCLLLQAFIFNVSYADNVCANSWDTATGNTKAILQLTSIPPYYSVPLAGVLGEARLTTSLLCHQSTQHPFVLQSTPASPAISGNAICLTPLDGVGIRFLSDTGTPIPCSSLEQISRTAMADEGQTISINSPLAVEFIRTKAVTSLINGSHTLKMPPASLIQSYRDGYNSSEKWGSYVLSDPMPLDVSSCMLTSTTTIVNFGNVVATDPTNSKSFDIQLNQCANSSEAVTFNNATKFEFISSQLLPNGTLANKTCSGCAQNLAIAITTANGTPINLNQGYLLKNGTFSIADGSITHQFLAKLTNTGTRVTSGKIDTMVTFILSPI